MLRGIVMSVLTFPLASAWNGNSRMVLRSSIVPYWLAGTWPAVTTTDSPALTVVADSERVTFSRAAYQIAPPMSSRTRAAAMPAAIRRRWDFRFGGGWVGAAQGMATVAFGLTRSAILGSATATAAWRPASGSVATAAGASTTVLAATGSVLSASAASSASTNAVQLSHRAEGSLARPRRMTSSTRQLSELLWPLGGSGSRCTCE